MSLSDGWEIGQRGKIRAVDFTAVLMVSEHCLDLD